MQNLIRLRLVRRSRGVFFLIYWFLPPHYTGGRWFRMGVN